jgi:hypothetical protein
MQQTDQIVIQDSDTAFTDCPDPQLRSTGRSELSHDNHVEGGGQKAGYFGGHDYPSARQTDDYWIVETASLQEMAEALPGVDAISKRHGNSLPSPIPLD